PSACTALLASLSCCFCHARAPAQFFTLSLHDALPISSGVQVTNSEGATRINSVMMTAGTYDAAGDFAFYVGLPAKSGVGGGIVADRKSTRLNSSHVKISYAVFCLKKKQGQNQTMADET